MAEEQEKESSSGGLRFRLPKLFAETVEEPTPSDAELAVEQIRPGDDINAIAAAAAAAPGKSKGTPRAATPAPRDTGGTEEKSPTTFSQSTDPAQDAAQTTMLLAQMQAMQEEIQRMHEVVLEINDRENAHEKVFNTLHAELREYKTDFIYEHFKPVVRPLLFLYDSLEQFDAEIALYERPNTGERRQTGLSPQLVRDNIAFFRDQLAESLRICEVTPMETPSGAFNPKLHKVIDVVPADESQDGIIQRVVRSGWYLNGQLLRPAEVIVGKKM